MHLVNITENSYMKKRLSHTTLFMRRVDRCPDRLARKRIRVAFRCGRQMRARAHRIQSIREICLMHKLAAVIRKACSRTCDHASNNQQIQLLIATSWMSHMHCKQHSFAFLHCSNSCDSLALLHSVPCFAGLVRRAVTAL